MSKKIIFHDNSLSERGTTIAIYDYAFWAREYLDLDPVICFDLNYPSVPGVLDKFTKEFKVVGYHTPEQLQQGVKQEQPDYFYAIKYGIRDYVIANGPKNLIHSVFNVDSAHVHGDIYAVVSEWQSLKSNRHLPFVPHMLNLSDTDEDLRIELGIPKNALVVGRHGAYDTFDLEFVVDTVKKVLEKRSDIWFVFLNTEKKIEHPRCIYLDRVVDSNRKFKFINTCDAMLHARSYGETFGLSVLEFAAMNKQIISYDDEHLQTTHPLGGRNHFLFLKDNCFKYSSDQQLGYLLMHLTRKNPFDTLYLRDQFSPKSVMSIFENVFLT
jgi:glycosyltransferase involved in cell wall biosynthesis